MPGSEGARSQEVEAEEEASHLAGSSSSSAHGGAFSEESALSSTTAGRLAARGRNLLQTTFYYWGIEFFTWSTAEFAAEYAASIEGDFSISLLGMDGILQ